MKSYQRLVLVGIVPAVFAVLVLLFFVRERKVSPAGGSHCGSSLNKLMAGIGTRFKVILVIMSVFTLGNSSDFFVILRVQNLGPSVFHVVLMLLPHNVTYAVTSVPARVPSDKLGRRRVIIFGWSVYALVYLGFAQAVKPVAGVVVFCRLRGHYGVVEGVARAFVADLVPEGEIGTAYGLYQGVVGITLLHASLINGWLWQTYSLAAPFYLGAGRAFLAMIGITVLSREWGHKHSIRI